MQQADHVRQSPAAEAALVLGLQLRQPQAVATFVNRSHHAVFALACRLKADPDLRQDWVHSVLLIIIEDLGRGAFVYRQPGSFWGWFRKRAYFLMLDQKRDLRNLRQRELADEDLPELIGTMAAENTHSPADDLEHAEIRRLFGEGLARIGNQEQRQALWLLLDQDHSYLEIAQIMGAELNTVRSWIRRGRIAMRQFIGVQLELGSPSYEVSTTGL